MYVCCSTLRTHAVQLHCCIAVLQAWEIYRSLDVEYVFVVFGGLVGYPSDDINKFLWMVRIGGGVYPGEAEGARGGVEARAGAESWRWTAVVRCVPKEAG